MNDLVLARMAVSCIIYMTNTTSWLVVNRTTAAHAAGF